MDKLSKYIFDMNSFFDDIKRQVNLAQETNEFTHWDMLRVSNRIYNYGEFYNKETFNISKKIVLKLNNYLFNPNTETTDTPKIFVRLVLLDILENLVEDIDKLEKFKKYIDKQ